MISKNKKRSSPKSGGFFWPKSQIFRPKAVISKKKVFAEIRVFFLAEIANFNVFSAQNTNFLLPKKYRGGARKKNRGGKNENRGGIASCPPAGDAPAWKHNRWCMMRSMQVYVAFSNCQTSDKKLDDPKLHECAHFILCLVTLGCRPHSFAFLWHWRLVRILKKIR